MAWNHTNNDALITDFFETVEEESSQAQVRSGWHPNETKVPRGHDHLPLGVPSETVARQRLMSKIH